MNILHRRISKTIALLIVLLLPVQPRLSATCCCRRAQVDASHIGVATSSCCTKSQPGCCSAAASKRSCCRNDRSDAGKQPCQCPFGCGGCGKLIARDVVAVTVAEVVVPLDVTTTAVVVSLPVVAVDNSRTDRWGANSRAGAHLCVLLCRFTL